MRISVRFRIYPDPIQIWGLWIGMEAQRCIYNAKIEQSRVQEWLKRRAILSPSWCALSPDLDLNDKIDKTYAQFKVNSDIPCVPSQILRNGVDKYIQAVRNHQHNPKKWNKPRPQREVRGLVLSSDLFEFRDGRLWIGRPKWPIGFIRMKAHRPHGIPATIVIRETRSGRWFLSFSYDDKLPDPPTNSDLKKQIRAEGEQGLQGKVLGIDRGVHPVVTLSSEENLGLDAILHGRRVLRLQARKRRLRRKLSRQKDGDSNRRQKTLREMARTTERLQDIRRDTFRKAVCRLVQGPMEVFVVEDLKLKGIRKTMLAKTPAGRMQNEPREGRRKVARAMLRASLGEFDRMLQSAAHRAWKLLLWVPPQHSSTLCSACGHRSPKNRPDRSSFQCMACHQAMDPDVNAARNLASRGLRTLFPNPPAGQAGVKARGGVGRTARRTAPKSGPKAKRNEKSPLQIRLEDPGHATHNTADPWTPSPP